MASGMSAPEGSGREPNALLFLLGTLGLVVTSAVAITAIPWMLAVTAGPNAAAVGRADVVWGVVLGVAGVGTLAGAMALCTGLMALGLRGAWPRRVPWTAWTTALAVGVVACAVLSA